MGEIYNISSALPFLDSLAQGIIERFEKLEEITIYLPNRRSTKPLAESFFRAAGEKALILPKIETIGDVDEDLLELKYFPDYKKIPPAISHTERLYQLARLIHEKSPVKTDLAQSIALAKSLSQLMDELQRNKVGLEKLNDVVPQQFAAHWQITLDFLKIIPQDWQIYLDKRGLVEPITRRNLLIEKLAAYYRNNPPPAPQIIAGTTGSMPSTVELIKAVLNGDNGYLVLNGLDKNLRDDDFSIIEETHPQYNLNLLLNKLGEKPSKVKEWKKIPLTKRQKIISTSLLPTERTTEWKNIKTADPGLNLVEAMNLEEEAMAIALILREVLEDKNKTALVVTNNRNLAKRITTKMRLWDVEVNDSAGENFIYLPTSTFLLELVEMLRVNQAPIPLLSFFKHPFIPTDLKNKIRHIECAHLRGPRIENFDLADYDVEIIGLKDLAQLFRSKSASLAEIFELHLKVAEQIATPEELWKGRGFEIYEFLHEFKKTIDVKHQISPSLYPEILRSFIATGTHWPKGSAHPRLNIYSPQEARMQFADTVILAGMNEGNLPALPPADSFMNQQIRKTIGLDLLSRGIGQAAHDFELLSQAKTVIYTRSKKEGGAPTVKSRFLLRLEAICNLTSGEKYCHWAQVFYEPLNTKPQPVKRPKPIPPLAARPRQLSVTQVGKLMRDPYVIYAEKILNLKKLDDIDAEITANKFGSFIHSALERFSKNYDGKLATLLKIGEQEFSKYRNKLGARAFWWPKFLRIAEWFITNEKAARLNNKELLFEEIGEIKTGGLTFTAQADRIEIENNLMKIIDYKTGQPPGFNLVEAGLDPQLALEAIIFGKKFNKEVTALEYWYLKGREGDSVEPKGPKTEKIKKIIEAAGKGINDIATKFLDEKTPFIARPWSRYALHFNDYEHLERIKEWDE